jgi:hypothetical protein
MQIPNCRVIAIGNGFDPNFAFERRIGVIQDCIDWMRRVAVGMPIIWNRPAARAAPFNRRASEFVCRIACPTTIGVRPGIVPIISGGPGLPV